jgi:predicted methyltransferase
MLKRVSGLIAAVGAAVLLTGVQLAFAQEKSADSAAVQESPALPAEQIPQNIKDAIAAPDRPAADRKLDAGRRPDQMLAFFGIEPGMKVADLFSGGGYTTELLSRAVGANGTGYAQNPIFPPAYQMIQQAWDQRLRNPALKNVTAVSKGFDDPDLIAVPPDSLDAVIMNMNYHDLVLQKLDRAKVNKEVFKALKFDGVYGIVDHSAKAGSGDKDVALHRIDENFLIAEVEQAGFKLAAASNALRHPDDDRTWSTSPRVAGAKRGTSDRFMLKFVKQ